MALCVVAFDPDDMSHLFDVILIKDTKYARRSGVVVNMSVFGWVGFDIYDKALFEIINYVLHMHDKLIVIGENYNMFIVEQN